MTLTQVLLCLLIVAVVAIAVGVWLARQDAPPEPEVRPAVIPDPPPIVTPPDPVVPPAPAPLTNPHAPPHTIVLRLLSETGRLLGSQRIPAKGRRPQMTFTTKGGRGVFVASHQITNSNDWVYRRVGVEREN